MEQDTEEINDLIKIKEEVQEILPTHENNESDCIASVIKEEINELIKIKEEVQEILPTHDFNESDCTVSDDKNVLYNLVKIKEELDPIAADDEKQIVKLVKEESSQEDSIEQITAKSQQSVSTWITSMNKAQILNELKKLGLETPRTIDECRTVLRNYMKSKLAKQKEQNESTQEDSIEQITAKPKQCVSNWIMSMNKVQIQNELRKLGLNTPRTVDECRSVLRNYMKNKSVNQKEQNFKVEDEEEEKCVLPLVPDIQQSLQPAEELILPDLLTPSSSSQNDFKINKSKHWFSDNDSASASHMEITKQGLLDGHLIKQLSIVHKTNKKDNKLENTSIGSRSKLTAPNRRITRSSTVYTETPVNSKPESSNEGLVEDVIRKQLNKISSPNNLESLSVVGNTTKLDRNECSVEVASICIKSTKLKDSSKVTEVNSRLSNLSGNVDYRSGDSNETLQIGVTSNKVVNKSAFRRYRTELKSSIDVAHKRNNVYILKCKLCGKKFDRPNKLRRHKESKCGSVKVDSSVNGFGCDQCGKVFSQKRRLMEHVKKDHLNSGRFNCDLCDKVYASKQGLDLHRNSYHLSKTFSNLLPQTCKYCQKICTSKRHLYIHVRRKHSCFEPERFECEHCSQVFASRLGIISHIHSEHLQSNLKCVHCKRWYSCEQNLQDHLKSNICRKNSTPYICEQCGKVLRNNISLTNHLLTHTDEKPHICKLVGNVLELTLISINIH